MKQFGIRRMKVIAALVRIYLLVMIGFRGLHCETNIDDCVDHMCRNGSECIDGVNSYTCKCPPTHTGAYCDSDIDECANNPTICKNGATCTNKDGGYICVCVNGWIGAHCNVNNDDCQHNQCYNNGTCVDHIGYYSCICPHGKTVKHKQCVCKEAPDTVDNRFALTNNLADDSHDHNVDLFKDKHHIKEDDGLRCHLEDACVSSPCKHNGSTCETAPFDGAPICTCQKGWTGTLCEEDINECREVTDLCEHGGTCVNIPGDYRCECAPGFTGRRCEENIKECLSNPCLNAGTCLDDTAKYVCACLEGYAGVNCEREIDECASNPCKNGGVCEDRVNGYRCTCPMGFSGLTCQVEKNMCESSPCENEAICTNLRESYTCTCQTGWTGPNCETNINDCVNVTCVYGQCIDQLGSFLCKCSRGYTGTYCDVEIDECQSNPCKHGGTCKDYDGGYECQCPRGTTGYNCEYDHNDCTSNPCLNGAHCEDSINSYSCSCQPGFTGRNCEVNIDECYSNPCYNGGHCRDGINSFTCDCPEGYYDDQCRSNINECASNPCVRGSCKDGVNTYHCTCEFGFEGVNCDRQVNNCKSNPCQHASTCSNHLGYYTCHCSAGYTGTNCESNINECKSNPCIYGSCRDLVDNYMCLCDPQYTGRNCETKMDPCTPNRCQNSAHCVPQKNFTDYYCNCSGYGYTGRHCDQDVNECAKCAYEGMCPCKNGLCQNTPGSYQCNCNPGYEGKHCEVDHNDCFPNQCKNGGRCYDMLNGFNCSCLPGFTGALCEKDIDECSPNPCRNGAECHDYVYSYTCTCLPGFSGQTCSKNDYDCTNSSCLNGGQCIDGINSYRCHCANGYTGTNCEHHINPCDFNQCMNGAMCINTPNGHHYCQCPTGFQGAQCQEFVDWCSQGVCENGATCTQMANEYYCECPATHTGRVCDVQRVTCEVAAQLSNVDVSKLCNHGDCQNDGDSHRCLCQEGYEGSYCDRKKTYCQPMPCQNNGNCTELRTSFKCSCPRGFTGPTCDKNIDDCAHQPCANGGTCHDLVGTFICSCPPGTSGYLCDTNHNDCYEGACHNGGICRDKINGFICECPAGFVGPQCEGDINECLSNPCSVKGTLSCQQLINDYRCQCKIGFTGRHCMTPVNHCAINPCNNNGQCINGVDGPSCKCQKGFSGALCGRLSTLCDQVNCLNGGECVLQGSSFKCNCPSGWSGNRCETDIDECVSNPCINNGECMNRTGYYECLCPKYYTGLHCEVMDRTVTEGIGKPAKVTPSLPSVAPECIARDCPSKAGNGQCDPECNIPSCDYDAQDCSEQTRPYKNCNEQRGGVYCWNVFNDSKCDQQCMSEECLFDGFDCGRNLGNCNPHYDSFCEEVFNDGVCNTGCDTAACNWDGSDCDSKHQQLAIGTLILYVGLQPEEARNKTKEILRDVGKILRVVLVIKVDKDQNEMIFPWYKSDEASRLRRAIGSNSQEIGLSREIIGSKIHVLIDIRHCLEDGLHDCFDSSEMAAEFIMAAILGGWKPSKEYTLPYAGSTQPDDPPKDKGMSNVIYIVMACALVVILTVVVLVVIFRKKTVSGITWFPEGFFTRGSDAGPSSRTSKRHVPDGGEEMRTVGKGSMDKVDNNDNNTEDDWHSDQPAKRIKLEYSGESTTDPSDTRQWTSQHLVAANVPNSSIMALTPPTGDDLNSRDVDVRGPDGFTPLMLAAIRGMGLDSGNDIVSTGSGTSGDSEEYDERSPEIIRSLLNQGASIDAQTDRTGETSLHLAARYARADAAKALLDLGADPNFQDTGGRTPLHTAVAADAQGVFQILLRNRSTNLNARTHDGTTPMILAARLAIEGMVEELINADADINAIDEYGKTPLHWAAAVNNADATLTLLQHGANRDAQDSKDETPLFLAAREGSFEAAKILLDHYANREITDHMDRLPRDVAAERMHHDIHHLLEEYRVTTMSGMTMHNGMPTTNGLHPYMHPPKPKNKVRKNKHNGQMKDQGLSPEGAKKPRVKKKRAEPQIVGQNGEGSSIGTMSPGDSIESPTGYDMTPPAYDNVCGGTMMGLRHSDMNGLEEMGVSAQGIQLQNLMDDHCVMSNHYKNESVLDHQQSMDMWLQGQHQQHAMSQSPMGVSIPTPPSSNPSHNSPLSMDGKLSPMKSKSGLPTSPPHYLAMQQHAQRNRPQKSPHHYHMENFPFSNEQTHIDNSSHTGMQPYTIRYDANNHRHKSSTPLQVPHVSQYPTPPSQHSYMESTPPQGLTLPENILTPSPDSPGHWSSSSPHSAQSDWSEGISSPVPPIGQHSSKGRNQIPSDAVYI